MSTSTETFQISAEAAEYYEAKFVPGIFAEWAPQIVEFAGVAPGRSVLDVACGTGIVTRAAADLVGPNGSVVGVDLNEAMLDVAGRVRADIEWKQGDAAALPFPDRSFEVALCQMALMFFPDRVQAIREMGRVASDTVAVLVPGAIDAQPAYGPFVRMAAEHAGPEAINLLDTYWSCGDLPELVSWLEAAGLTDIEADTRIGTVRFDSPEELAATEVEGSPLIERIDEETYARIKAGAREVLDPFTTETGTLEAPIECHLVKGRVSG